MTTLTDETTSFQQKRRVRAFLISPLQLLRCFQLLAAGVKLEAEVFPAGVALLYSEDTQFNGETVFLLMLEHNSFIVTPVVKTANGLV